MANFDAARAIFSQVDTNKDGSIDPNEFRNWVAANSAGGGLTSSSYESSSFQSSTDAIGASSNLALSGSADLTGIEGADAYQASYSSQSGLETSDSLALGGLANSYGSSSSSSELVQTGGVSFESSNLQQSIQYDSKNIYKDPNPQLIKRAAIGGAVTYQQKILVRFLQPPPVPPPGPLIIKEIRPPQPPPPPPLVVRQRAPPVPQPPPLILRERPPVPPAPVASKTVIRRLAAIPVPPRSVIVERLPPLPPKPRDIIIERWIPYGAQAKRRTIVQRAAAAKEYPKPRNIIIVYDAVQARIVRQFQRLGVTQENPQAYLSRYGVSLLDATTLVQQARAAGVVEDISPPAVAAGNASISGAEASYGYSASSTAETSDFDGLRVVGLDGGATGGNYSSESYSSSSSYGTEGALAGSTEFDLAAATFAVADTNKDGSLDKAEFEQFVKGGL